jgi:hypothetical protein
VNVKSKEKSKQWMHSHSPKKPKRLKNVACQKADNRCFLGQERRAVVEFMSQGTAITLEVYCKTLNHCIGPFRTKGVEC